jgi:hypothetical protein
VNIKTRIAEVSLVVGVLLVVAVIAGLHYFYYAPQFASNDFDAAYARHERATLAEDEGRGAATGAAGTTNPPYPNVALATLARDKFSDPRATVEGTVRRVSKEADGDYHILVTDGTYTIVCEIAPDLWPVVNGAASPLARPRAGMTIRIWGVARRDVKHGWNELHPVVGWEEKK